MRNARLVLLLFITSCTLIYTPQQQAESLAKGYLDSAIIDFDTYELVTSMAIDTLRDGPDNEPAYQLITAKINSTYLTDDSLKKALTVAANADARRNIEAHITKNSTNRNALLQQSLQYMLNYQGKPNGWILEQTYRSKKNTDSTLHVHVFKMDSELSKVVGYQSRKK